MKTLLPLFVFASISAVAAHASGLDEYLSKVRSVIEKDDRSEFCVVEVPIASRAGETTYWPREAVCVGNLTVGSGMNERGGCVAFSLNLMNTRASPVGLNGRQKMVEGKKCEDAFEELMGMTLYNDTPVGWLFYDVYGGVDYKEPYVAYVRRSRLSGFLNRKSKYEEWFAKKRAEVIAHKKKPKANE